MRIVWFDTESTNLAAAWGRVLCASFADGASEPYTFRSDRKKWAGRNAIDDGPLCVAIRDELESADIIVGWNSILHDVPLVNARLARVGERPVRLGEKHGTWHLDLMWYAGGQSMKIGGRRLDLVAKYFGSEDQKTPLDPETWQLAGAGEKKAMDLVVEHCEADVKVLRTVGEILGPTVKKFQVSIGEIWPLLDQVPSRR